MRRKLFELAVEHSYWAPDAPQGLELCAVEKTSIQLRKYRLETRCLPRKIEVWADIFPGAVGKPAFSMSEWVFFLKGNAVNFWKYTEWNAEPSTGRLPVFANAKHKLELKRQSSGSRVEGGRLFSKSMPLAKIKVNLPKGAWKFEKDFSYQLKLNARSAPWTYLLVTRQPSPDFSITGKDHEFRSATLLDSDTQKPLEQALLEQYPASDGFFIYAIRSTISIPLHHHTQPKLTLQGPMGPLSTCLRVPDPANNFTQVLNLLSHHSKTQFP